MVLIDTIGIPVLQELVEGMSVWAIAGMFLIIAFAYSSVGLGGGSSYTALLTILGIGHVVVPTVSLSLNLIVVSAGSFNFIQQKHARFSLIWPFLVTSVPMAYLGGSLQVSKLLFEWLLLVSLVLVAARIYFWKDIGLQIEFPEVVRKLLPFGLGAVLGLVAGIVGIGGGIYLVPLILIFNLGGEKEAAAAGAIFILVNSLIGLVARVQFQEVNILEYWPILVAVAAGGIAGSRLGAATLPRKTMQKILGGIILIAIVLLGRRVFFG